MTARSVEAILSDLRDGKLRDIDPKLHRLSAAEARAVSRALCRRLDEIVSADTLGHAHRWVITALQHLTPPKCAPSLVKALKQSINLKGCCGCTLTRTLRALGAVRPPEAIPALVDVIRETKHPRHKHLAGVCIEKIVGSGGPAAEAILAEQQARLRRELTRIRRAASTAKRVTPSKPWLQPPGSPGWLHAADRAVQGLTRLLAHG